MKTKSKNTIPKKQRLKSKRDIDALFQQKKSIIAFPIRLVYAHIDTMTSAYQVAFSVPKKKFKLAVDRNRIKRLMRESFRKQRHQIETQKMAMMWLYMDHKKPEQKQIDACISKIIEQLNRKETPAKN